MAKPFGTFSAVTLVICFIAHCLALNITELHDKYNDIFYRSGNRNAASHLWSSYVLERAPNLTELEIYNLFSGFCPVSGSPIVPSPRSVWKNVAVKNATDPNHVIKGTINFCCWPCVCDLQAWVGFDTLRIDTKDGRNTFNALVIGNWICKN